jgi:hypothetical protein
MDIRPVKIYAQQDSPRLRYIAGIILNDILGLQWEIITDKRKLGKYHVINYSVESINGSFKISPSALLFEKGVAAKEIRVEKWRDLPVFFQSSVDSDIPFDIFAASFYLVSRYEEYSGYETDEYGRFRASTSLAFKNGFLEMPVVDLWAKELAMGLLKKFQTLAFRGNDYRALVTFDTDEPFEYLGKGILRSIGGLLRDLTSNDVNASDRYNTVTGNKPDTFEVFDYITECVGNTDSDAMFFFPVGDRSKFDHNPSWKNEEYRSLILRLAKKYRHGIHPSFNASDNISILMKESSRLKTILGNDISKGRFHYIRLKIPESYRLLQKAGIHEDYSMGYPEEPGFRAGIARPYYFYDIEEDRKTELKIIPFQVMDATLYKYRKLDCKAALEKILNLINETKRSGGLFVTIWHNTSLIDNSEFRGWREVFESMLKNQSR